jgi:hypothetical protein
MENAEGRKPTSDTVMLRKVGEELRGRIPRKHHENTMRIRREHESNTLASR